MLLPDSARSIPCDPDNAAGGESGLSRASALRLASPWARRFQRRTDAAPVRHHGFMGDLTPALCQVHSCVLPGDLTVQLDVCIEEQGPAPERRHDCLESA